MNTPNVITKLLALLDNDPGFAGMSASLATVAATDDDSAAAVRRMTNVILGDAGVTMQLIRKANSSGRAGESVSTIDKALLILGMNNAKALVRTLAPVDVPGALGSKAQAEQLHAEIVAAAFCGRFAGDLTRINAARLKAQESQVCGLLQNLGRLLACYYLHDEIVKSHALQAEQNLSEDDAVNRTLGISFDEIGAAVARHWKFPDVLQKSLEPGNEKVPVRSIASTLEWHQHCGRFARRITDILFRTPEHQAKGAIGSEIYAYRSMLQLRENDVTDLIDYVLKEMDTALGTAASPCSLARARELLRKSTERVTDWLSPQDSLTRSSGPDARKTRVEVIYQILRSIHDAFNFDMTLLCLPNGTAELVAISGVGRNANQIISRFRCSGPKPDLFRSIAAKTVGLYVGDVQGGPYAKFIPDWYPTLVGARSLYAMSLMDGQEPLGIIYGDYTEQRSVAPEGLDGERMRQWRSELIALVRPAGGGAKG